MFDKTINTRIVNKHAREADWLTSTLIPLCGELIIYDKEVDSDGNVIKPERLKIGDGVSNVNDLDFVTSQAGGGSGDMEKSVYDTDGDGVVDNAERLGGVDASAYAKTEDLGSLATKSTVDKDDLSEDIQQSLNKADTAIQSVEGLATEDYVDNLIESLGDLAAKSTVEKSDLSADVQTSLNKADTALQSFTETDPTVPEWAKADTKPSYTAGEVGAVPTSRTVNGKALSSNITLSASDVGAIPDTIPIPDSLADLTSDATHRTVTDTEKSTWNAKATTAYVDQKVADIVDSSPETLDTLNELAAALGDDPNFATTVATEIGKKVDKTTTVNGHALSDNVTVTKSDLDLSNVENKSSATIRGELTKDNVTNALGYTPPKQDTVYTLPSAGAELGGVKTGGDVTISDGVITINDDSHNHIIDNVDGLQNTLDEKTIKATRVEDSASAYIKEVPSKSASYARVDMIGGMTRKCTNLIPLPYASSPMTDGGVTIKVNEDASVSVSGNKTGTSAVVFHLVHYTLPAGTYCLSGLNANGDYDTFHIGCDIYELDGRWADIAYDIGNGTTITLDRKMRIQIFIRIYESYTGSVNFTAYPMLNAGTTALPYEPYFEGLRSAPVTEVKSISGVNLIPFPYATPNGIYNGVNFTANADGSISVSGTANNSVEFVLFDFQGVLPDGDYTIRGTVGDVKVYINKNINGVYSDVWGETSFNCSGNVTGGKCYLYVQGGKTVNATIYPMLNKGSTALPYTPYVKHTLPIPAEVQAKDGYGDGTSAEYNNYVRYGDDGSVTWRKHTKRKIFTGNESWSVQGANSNKRYFRCKLADIGVIAQGEVVSNYYDTAEVTSSTENIGVWVVDSPTLNTGNLTIRPANILDITLEEWEAQVAEWYAAGTPLEIAYSVIEPEVEDISNILPADNYLGVEGGGTLTFVNEYGYDVPSEVTWYENSNDIIGAEEFVGDLIGTAARAISDKNGNDITKTYATKDEIVDFGSGDMLKSVYDTDGDGIVDKATQDGNGNNIVNTYATKTAVDAKQATITGAATTITDSNLTASRALISNSSGKVAVSAVTSTELGYLDGVESNIQTQLDGKADSSHNHTSLSGPLSITGTASSTAHLKFNRDGYNYITFPEGGNLAFATDANGDGIVVGVSSSAMYPYNDNEKTLGTSDNKWSNVYATTFTGELSGNATTATKATQDGSGNVISNTYVKRANAITGLSARGRTVTYIKGNGTKGTITTQDMNVQQTLTTDDASYPLLLAPSGLKASIITTSYFDSGVTLNPSTNTIEANISGNAATATSCTGNAATATTLSCFTTTVDGDTITFS